jgi:hypothetical protein
MTHARLLGSTIAFLGAASLVPACILDPMSSGELDGEATGGSDGDDGDADTNDPGATSTAPGDDGLGSSGGDETGGAPAATQWSDIVPTSGYASVCGVAIDPTGRVAVTWLASPGATSQLDHAGLRVYDPGGTDSVSIEATGEVFGDVAFASDGTLRMRGGTLIDGQRTVGWARAYDASLQESWTATYEEKVGWTGCGNGWRGVAIDATDHVVTYNYTCGEGVPCPQSVIRRHAPDGTLLWERNPSGNPGVDRAPLAVSADGSVFDGAIVTWDDYDEVEIRKHDPDGTELWMTLLMGDARGLWPTPDGGAWVLTGSWDPSHQLYRLDGSGDVVSTIDVPDPILVVGPADDDAGFFALGDGDLQRLDDDMQLEWSMTLQHAPATVSKMGDDGNFVFAGSHAAGGDNFWVTSLTLP